MVTRFVASIVITGDYTSCCHPSLASNRKRIILPVSIGTCSAQRLYFRMRKATRMYYQD